MAKPARKTTETTVSLGSDLRIGRAREVFNMLDAANKAAGKSVIVVIDAAEVSKIDTAGLQALTAATVRFRTAGTKWRWHNPSPILTNAAKLLGLESALEIE